MATFSMSEEFLWVAVRALVVDTVVWRREEIVGAGVVREGHTQDRILSGPQRDDKTGKAQSA